MAYRANLFDFGAVEGAASGANAAANDAAFLAAKASPTAIIEIEPGIFEISQTMAHDVNGKTFIGTRGNDCFGSLTHGTRFDWYGADGGEMLRMAPTVPGRDLYAPTFSNVSLYGRGVADRGLTVLSSRCFETDYVQVMGLRPLGSSIGAYFGSAGVPGVGDVNCAYEGSSRGLVVNACGAGHGIMVDGKAGYGNTCFGVWIGSRVTHVDGIGYYLRGCDDNQFYSAKTSRGLMDDGITPGTGLPILFDGIDHYCVGNSFWAFHGGATPAGGSVTVFARGTKARQNIIMALSGVDTQPVLLESAGAELNYLYLGGGYTPTLAAEKALFRMPKRDELIY